MASERRGVRQRLQRALLAGTCLLLIAALSACASVVGGGVLIGVVTIGALTSRCYDYLDVTVLDEHGRKTCAATVTVSNGTDHFELGSCYYTPLTDGVWLLRATLPGAWEAVSTVPVEHAEGCTRHVQSVELTLSTPSSHGAQSRAPQVPVPLAPPSAGAAMPVPSSSVDPVAKPP